MAETRLEKVCLYYQIGRQIDRYRQIQICCLKEDQSMKTQLLAALRGKGQFPVYQDFAVLRNPFLPKTVSKIFRLKTLKFQGLGKLITAINTCGLKVFDFCIQKFALNVNNFFSKSVLHFHLNIVTQLVNILEYFNCNVFNHLFKVQSLFHHFCDIKTHSQVTIFSKPTGNILPYSGQKFNGALEFQISS